MAEACRKKTPRIKTAELVATLEKLEVADYPLPDELPTATENTAEPLEDNQPVLEDETSSGIGNRNETNTHQVSFEEKSIEPEDVHTDSKSLYPQLECLNEIPPLEIGTPATDASAPLFESSIEKTSSLTFEYSLPAPLTDECLKNLYFNPTLDSLDSMELEFLKAVQSHCRGELSISEDRDLFQKLISNYIHCWSQWQHAMERFRNVRRDTTELKSAAWKLSRKTSKVTGKCRDGVSVVHNYAYEEAIFVDSVSSELSETQDVMRWIVFEELPELAYDLSRMRNQISEHILMVLTSTDVYRKLGKTEPIHLIGPNVTMDHTRQINDVRWIASVLFAALRQHFSIEFQGQSIDPSLAKQLCEWVSLSAGTLIRFCRAEDHLFLLMHLLRLPSKLLKFLCTLVQPPDPTVIWSRSCTVQEFLEQPEIQLHLTMFAACLRPVRNRSQFLLVASSETDDAPETTDPPLSPHPGSENPWVVLDSGGESDSDESLLPTSSNATGPFVFSQNIRTERTIFIGPKDLDRLLRQLDLVRLINLLRVGEHDGSNLAAKESGLLTLMAFANRMMELIESCGAIYSDHLQAPKSRDHLGCWRTLAKRLASIVSALVTTVGSRVRLAWFRHQQKLQRQQLHQDSAPDSKLLQILSQYDELCLRATKCLLSGCGLPSTHRDAVRLVGWRYLTQLFPFGLVSSRSKIRFLHLIITSLLPCWKPDAVSVDNLPEHVIGPLHQALLSIGLNDIGLGSIVNTLGKLASVECRPIVYCGSNSPYHYCLPELEASLVRTITCIIFGLSVYHNHRSSDTNSRTGQNGTGPIGLLPIAPDDGRKQLVHILSVHPDVTLHLLFQLIVTAGEQLCSQTTFSSSIKRKKRPYVIGPYRSDECIGTEKLLLLLATEAPFHYLRPSADDIDELIDWLVNRDPDVFVHILARTLLHRLSWESYLNAENGEPFLPLSMHLKFALSLAKLSEKRILNAARFARIQNHPVVGYIFNSTKSTASSAAKLVLSTLGYRQSPIKSSLSSQLQHDSRSHQREQPPSTNKVRRSRSQSAICEDESSSTSDPVVDWCVDLVIRLHLPGCAINLSDKSLTNEVKNELMNTWQQLVQFNFDRNPITAFLMLSIHCMLFTSATESTVPCQGNLRIIAESFHWKLILRAVSIVFYRYTFKAANDQNGDLASALNELLKPIATGQLRITTGSCFVPLCIGSCLYACLHQPLNCMELLKVLVANLCNRTDWFTRPDSLWLLDCVLRMDLWINQHYIPIKFGGQGDVLKWIESDVCKSVKDKLQNTYFQRISNGFVSWSEQLSTAASVAWCHSSRALFALKAHLIGSEYPSNFASDLSSIYNSPESGKSMLALFWPSLRHLQLDTANVRYSFPWWLATLMHSMDYDIQVSDATSSVGGNDPPTLLRGAWIRLSTVLSRHVDELIACMQQSMLTVPSSNTLPPSFVVLLERLLLEAGLLHPTIDANKSIARGLSVSVYGRVLAILSQLAVTQSVSLLVACPSENPVFSILLHTLLSNVFSSTGRIPTDATSQFTEFPTGLLLLRCLPWSFGNLGCTASELAFMGTGSAQADERRSLLSVLIGKLQWTITAVERNSLSEAVSTAQTDFVQALQSVLELLRGFDSTFSRNVLVDSRSRLLSINRSSQLKVLNALGSCFNWTAVTADVHTYAEQWNEHRSRSIGQNNVMANSATNEMERTPTHRPLAGQLELPYYPLDSLVSASVSSCIPASLDAYPRLIQAAHHKLLNWTKRFCDQIHQLEEFHGAYVTDLLRRLYSITNVRESVCVECHSILPSWIRSKRCSGGAYLSFNYRTALIDEEVHKMCIQNNTKVDDLLDSLIGEAYAAACGPSESVPNQGQWSQCGLQIEALVRHLIAFSTQVAVAQRQSTTSDPSQRSVKVLGMQCFEQLCQNLSGPLLLFPVSKKLLAECIRLLADEFLTSLSAAYERVLDLMVALPHLSGVLAPTFVPPSPALINDSDDSHPLTSVLERLIDVRIRCGAEAALTIFKKINVNAWCDGQSGQPSPLPIGSAKQYKALLTALYNCLKRLSDMNVDRVPQDEQLYEMYFEFLKSVLRNRLSESINPLTELLMEDVCAPKSEPLWNVLHQLLQDERGTYGKCSISIEKLLGLLNNISDRMCKPSAKIDGTQEVVFDEFLRLSYEYVPVVLVVFRTLLCELATKLGCCVREGHLTSASALPLLMDNLIRLLGTLLIKSSRNACSSEALVQQHGMTLVRATLSSISEVLVEASEVCSTEHNLRWTSCILDSFIQWLIRTFCPATKSEQFNRSTLQFVPLIIRLCMLEENDQSDSTSSWSLLALPWNSWYPSPDSLNSMIAVLNWCTGPGRDLHVEKQLASFILICLRCVDWTGGFKQTRFQYAYTVHGLSDIPKWCPVEANTESEESAFAGSIAFLCMLLAQALHDSENGTKSLLQHFIETVLSSFNVSVVGERCYAFMLSNMNELRWPAHCVLMPPTSLEGRLFGLLASAGGMTASSVSTTISSTTGEQSGKRLYPELGNFLPPDSEDSHAQNRKRLGYVQKITSLLQYALLRAQIPARDLDALKSGPLALSLVQPASDSTESQNSSTFTSLLTQTMSSLIRKVLPQPRKLAQSWDYGTDEPTRILVVLGWLRVGNLLSELEAVAANSTWANPASVEFQELTELCAEVVRLIHDTARQSIVPGLSSDIESSAVDQRLHLIPSAMVSWILGEQATETGLLEPSNGPRTSVMPRSIHAGLSRPFCYTILMQNAPTDQGCVSALVRVLEASTWSVLILAPNGMSFMERFHNLDLVFTEALIRHRNEAFLASINFIYSCLREAALLPLFCFANSRANRFGKANSMLDGPQILLADMLHWLTNVDWKCLTLENPVKLSGLLLTLSLITHILESKCANGENSARCCNFHPAWRSVQRTDDELQCPVAPLVKQFANALAEIRKVFASWKTGSEGNGTSSEHTSRLLHLINCVGSLCTSWLGSNSDESPFESLDRLLTESQQQSSSPTSEDQPTVLLSSIVSALLVRLPNFTLVQSVNYVCSHLWPELHPCVKQILNSLES